MAINTMRANDAGNKGNPTRKITKVGNSLGIGLPKKVLDELELKQGDELELEVQQGEIILKKNERIEDYIELDFLKMAENTFKKHDQVFKNLKDR